MGLKGEHLIEKDLWPVKKLLKNNQNSLHAYVSDFIKPKNLIQTRIHSFNLVKLSKKKQARSERFHRGLAEELFLYKFFRYNSILFYNLDDINAL
jgi:hypothetical protein